MGRSKTAIVYGRNALVEALQGGHELLRIIMQKGSHGQHIPEIKELAEKRHVPIQYLAKEVIPHFIRRNRIDHTIHHQGVIALVSPIRFYELDDLVSHAFEQGETPLFLLLDQVTDVRNLGAIARSAYCMGVHGIIIPAQHSAQVNEDAIQASAGALMHQAVVRVDKLETAMKQMRLHGIQLLAAEAGGDYAWKDGGLSEPVAIVMGAEGEGLTPSVKALTDRVVSIPMSREFDSLNVSVSAAILLYECMRQRKA